MPVRTRRQTARAHAALTWADEIFFHADLSIEVLKHLNLDGILAMRLVCSEARKLSGRVFSITGAMQRMAEGALGALTDAVREGDTLFVEVAYKKGLAPCHHQSQLAAGHGQLAMLKLFHEHNLHMSVWTCLEAARFGHLDCLVFLIKHGCSAVLHTGYRSTGAFYNPCTEAAYGGHMHVLQWAYKQGFVCDERTFEKAAASGRIDILEWLWEHGVPWDERACATAALHGRLECLTWLRQRGCPWDARTCKWAEHRNELECLQWAREQGCPE